MSSRAKKKHSRTYEFIRRVETDTLSIRLWIVSKEDDLNQREAMADEIASLAFQMVEDDDNAFTVCAKAADVFGCLRKIEAVDDAGDGVCIYP
jgi:phage gp46-like protein